MDGDDTAKKLAIYIGAAAIILLMVIAAYAPDNPTQDTRTDDPEQTGQDWTTRNYWSLFAMNHAYRSVDLVLRTDAGQEILNTSLESGARTPDRIRDHVCTTDPGRLNATIHYYQDGERTLRTTFSHRVACDGSVEVASDGTHRDREEPRQAWYLYIEPGPNLTLVPHVDRPEWVRVQLMNQCSHASDMAVFFNGRTGAAVLHGTVQPDDLLPPISPLQTNWTVGHEMRFVAKAFGDGGCTDSFEGRFTPEERDLVVTLTESDGLKWFYD